MAKKPSEIVEDVLTGKVDISDVDEGIQSWCRFFIYQGAVSVLSLNTKEERRKALLKIPENVRPLVEDEAKRVWAYRRSLT